MTARFTVILNYDTNGVPQSEFTQHAASIQYGRTVARSGTIAPDDGIPAAFYEALHDLNSGNVADLEEQLDEPGTAEE